MLLNERDVRAVLSMPELIDAMGHALRQFSSGAVDQPVRQVLIVDGNYFGVMPVAAGDPAAMGAKLVTVYHGNRDKGLTSHLATIVLLDHSTGALRALVDGRFITEARTAAVSAVSARHLARADARTLAILGSGVQARSHLEALRHVRPIDVVRVWSPNVERRNAFCNDMSVKHGIRVEPANTASEAARHADIIVLATAATTPVLQDGDVAPGTHVCAIGACRPDQREMPTALMSRAKLYVDSRVGALKEAGDILIPMAEGAFDSSHIAGEIGEVLNGRAPARRSNHDVTIFKSLGMAIEDIVAADLAVRRAQAAGIGQPLSLS